MPSIRVAPFGEASFVMPSTGLFSVFSKGTFKVSKIPVLANYPPRERVLSSSNVPTNGVVVYTAEEGATIIIRTYGQEAIYDYGGFGRVLDLQSFQLQLSPSSVSVSTTLTSYQLANGIITSATAETVDATLPPASELGAEIATMVFNDSFDWSVINTGPNAFNIIANTGHTLVGSGTVPTASSSLFRTRKVTTSTYTTYRLTT